MRKRDLFEELNLMIEDAVKDIRSKLFSGRPERSNSIGREDLINLKIALNSCKTIEEFVNQV